MTYSFPCTDLSVAGKMQGMSKAEWEKGNSTRSGLLWEVERILKECTELPQVLLYEVQTTALLSDKGTHLERFTDIATCLMARDFKGLGKQTGNGVIEYESRNKS